MLGRAISKCNLPNENSNCWYVQYNLFLYNDLVYCKVEKSHTLGLIAFVDAFKCLHSKSCYL